MTTRRLVGLAILSIGVLVVMATSHFVNDSVSAYQGCSVSLHLDPTEGPYYLGQHIQLSLNSNCGTVKFNVNGRDMAETGQPNQNMTLKTEEFGSGGISICALGRGEGGWENAARDCRDIYVEGGQGAPQGSTTGSNVACWVNSLVVTPGTAPVGHTFQLSAQGQCDGNLRAMKFNIDGYDFGETSVNTYGTNWNSSGYSVGTHTICVLVTAGGWDQAAVSCTTVTLTDGGQPQWDTSQGQPADNGQPGQTPQSGPNNDGVPQNNGSSSSNSGSSSGNSGGSSGSNSSESSSGTSNNLSPWSNVDSTSCSGNVSPVVGVSDRAMISFDPPDPNAIHNDPQALDRAGIIEPGTQFTIIGGPVCARNYWRWQIQLDNGEIYWTADGDNQDHWVVKVSGGNSGSGNQSSNSSSTTNQTACSTNVTSQVKVGDRAMISFDPPDPNAIHYNSGATERAGVIDPGTQFTIIGGPVCSRGLWRWQIQLDDGNVYWTADGDDQDNWVVKVSGGNTSGSSNGDGSPPLSLSYYYSPFQTTYNFLVDPENCVILNGVDIIAQELNRSHNWMQSLYETQSLSEFDLALYLKNEGGIDTFRLSVESFMVRETDCLDIYYQIGSHSMDTYGLGNIVYGYYSIVVPNIFAHTIADIDQFFEDGRQDFPDDADQIDLGRAIANSGRTVTPSLVESLISSAFTDSR